jgi:hypothetical protein
MRQLLARARRHPLRLTLLVCAILVLLPPAVAYAGTVFTYAQGTNGIGQTHSTAGYGPRDLNRVYHADGYFWEVWYCRTDGSCFDDVVSNINPTRSVGGASYAKAFCHNVNDNSGVLWTCQTTH